MFFLHHSSYCIYLTGFTQSIGQLDLYIDTIPRNASYSILGEIPTDPDISVIKKNANQISIHGKIITIPIPLCSEPTLNEYSVFIFLDDQWIELVRQSSVWLEKMFNFNRPSGYTILGRGLIHRTPEDYPSSFTPLEFVKRPDLSAIVPPLGSSNYLEVQFATGLLDYLWSKPIRQGPSSESYLEFLRYPLEEKLERVRSGKSAVMCQGFRDLFLHASYGVPHLKARAIEAMNYAPPFKDLITYGHSTAEIWLDNPGKWVIFDPWLGIMIEDINGELVGAFELQKQKAHPEQFHIVPVINIIPRMYVRSDQVIVYNDFDPQSVQMSAFSCSALGCAPGYLHYFHHLMLHDTVIRK
jgi:hypothetical protein